MFYLVNRVAADTTDKWFLPSTECLTSSGSKNNFSVDKALNKINMFGLGVYVE